MKRGSTMGTCLFHSTLNQGVCATERLCKSAWLLHIPFVLLVEIFDDVLDVKSVFLGRD